MILLDDETKRKLHVNVHSSSNKTKKQRYHEQLTDDDYKLLMGMYRENRRGEKEMIKQCELCNEVKQVIYHYMQR